MKVRLSPATLLVLAGPELQSLDDFVCQSAPLYVILGSVTLTLTFFRLAAGADVGDVSVYVADGVTTRVVAPALVTGEEDVG